MKNEKQIISLLWLLFFSFSAYSQGLEWDFQTGFSNSSEYGKDNIETYDKGFLLISRQTVPFSAKVNKIDKYGNLIWEKTFFNEDRYMYINKIIETSDSSYVMIGFSRFYTDEPNYGDPLIIKLNSCFEVEWCKALTFEEEYSRGVDILENEDNVLIVLEDAGHRTFLVGITLDGDVLWREQYAKPEDHPLLLENNIRKLIEFNGSYYLSGSCYYAQPGGDPNDYWLRPLFIGIDSDFEEKWILPYGVDEFLIGGTSYMSHYGGDTIYSPGVRLNSPDGPIALRFNEDGEELGYIFIPEENIGPTVDESTMMNLIKLSNNRFMGGLTYMPENFINEISEFVFDSLGNVYSNFPHPHASGRNSMIKTSDNKFVQAASKKEENYSKRDAFFYKFNSDFGPDTSIYQVLEYDYHCPDVIPATEEINLNQWIPIGVEEIPRPADYYTKKHSIPVDVYPKPASDYVTFSLGNYSKNTRIDCTIFDVFGHAIVSFVLDRKETKWQVKTLSAGVYFYRISCGMDTASGKIVVQ